MNSMPTPAAALPVRCPEAAHVHIHALHDGGRRLVMQFRNYFPLFLHPADSLILTTSQLTVRLAEPTFAAAAVLHDVIVAYLRQLTGHDDLDSLGIGTGYYVTYPSRLEEQRLAEPLALAA